MEKEQLEYFVKGLRKETGEQVPVGGQHALRFVSSIKLIHEELNFEVKIDGCKSQLTNLKFAMKVFELYLNEFHK